MKALLASGLVLACLLGAALAAEKDVVEMGDADFATSIAEHEYALVMFYAPWCTHCKRLKPEFAKAAEDLLLNDPPIALVKVDCTEAGKDTCSKHGVSGYPTLKIFRNGDLSGDYKGPRNAAGIVKYMKAEAGPSAKDLTTLEELTKFIDSSSEPVVVGFFATDCDLKESYLKLADRMKDKITFGVTSVKELLDKQGISHGVALFQPVHLRSKFEEDMTKYEGSSSVDELEVFIKSAYHGLVGHRKSENAVEFEKPLVTAFYSVDYVKNAKGTNYWRNRILKVAKEFTGALNFAIASKDEFQHELNEFGIDYAKGDKPVVLVRDENNVKFSMPDEFSPEAFKVFLDKLLAKELQPYVKSQPIPEKEEGLVRVAVGQNFRELVIDNGMDTLVEFYAPWCGHCQKLAPVYEELAEAMKNEKVSIVKVDATANDVPPPFEVHGYPTLYWVPKDDKTNPVKYNGGRELQAFIKYIAQNSAEELDRYDRSGNTKKTEL